MLAMTGETARDNELTEFAPIAAGSAAVDDLLPDLDLYGEHRQTLRCSVYYSLGAVPALLNAPLSLALITVALTMFVTLTTLHPVICALGGGFKLRPWEAYSSAFSFVPIISSSWPARSPVKGSDSVMTIAPIPAQKNSSVSATRSRSS